MTAKTVTTVTTADLREWFRADEKRLGRLSEAARRTVEKGARGKVHPEAVKEHNTRRRTRVYTVGATKAAVSASKAKAAADRLAVEKALGKVGTRGPLPKAAAEVLAKSKG